MNQDSSTALTHLENVFNRLRFKYLNAIYLSGTSNPSRYFSYDRNYLVRALLDDRHEIYEQEGISKEIRQSLCLETEVEELREVITGIIDVIPDNLERLYAELIALKPGFHELVVHSDYFEDDLSYHREGPLKQVFSILHERNSIDSLNMERWPDDMKPEHFLVYAPCNITEGPIVVRRAPDGSYFDEILKVTTSDKKPLLEDIFNIVPYHNTYLFDLGSIDSDHTEQARLSAYLRETHNIQLAQDAPITKSDDNRQVVIGNEDCNATIRFSEDFNTAHLTSGNFHFDGFNVVHDRGGYIYLYHATVRNRDALKAVLKAAKPLLHPDQG